MAEDSDDGPILVDQTQVPRSSLFVARVDAESAIAADELLKPPPTDAPTTRSDNSGTELDENLSDLSDDFEIDNSRGQSVRRTMICCSRRCRVCLSVIVIVAAIAALVVGILGFTDNIDLTGNKAVTPIPPVIDDAPGTFGKNDASHC